MADSNKIVKLNLLRPGSNTPVFETPFNPEFTYPIFGEDEQIFGYTKPVLALDFRATDMRPRIDFSYEKKFTAIGKTVGMDVVEMIKEFLPEGKFDFQYALIKLDSVS
jgi:histone acetyltransferase 1